MNHTHREAECSVGLHSVSKALDFGSADAYRLSHINITYTTKARHNAADRAAIK